MKTLVAVASVKSWWCALAHASERINKGASALHKCDRNSAGKGSVVRCVLQACVVAGLALGFATPLLAAVNPVAGCTLYVDAATGSDYNGGSAGAPFATPQGAENFLEEYRSQTALTTGSVTYMGTTHTWPIYTVLQAETICITSGLYTVPGTIPSNLGSNPNTGFPAGGQSYTLDIKVTGTAAFPVTFTAYDRSHPPTIQQTGWAAIQIEPTANYVTLSFLYVTGNAYSAVHNIDATYNEPYAITRYARAGGVPPDWSFYDGSCIVVPGNAYFDNNTQKNLPLGVPTHITIEYNQVFACGGGGIVAVRTDYLTIVHNAIYDNAWWSKYGESGISNLGVDSELYPVNTGNPIATTTVKTQISYNYVFNNREYVPWHTPSKITDGEGIIIDTNSNYSTNAQGVPTANPLVNPYRGQTQVSDNVVWFNGSSGIQAFRSGNVTISHNTLYKNRYYPPILSGTDNNYPDLDSSGYPTAYTTPTSNVGTNPEIYVYDPEPAGVANYVVSNIIYGPTPLRNQGCTATYTCIPIEGRRDDNQTGTVPYTYINYNLLYEAGGTVSNTSGYMGGLTISGDNYQVLNSDPQFNYGTAPPDQVFGQPYNRGTSNLVYDKTNNWYYNTLDLRVLPGSPASGPGAYGTSPSYSPMTDITGATQPNPTYNLDGAWAAPE